MHLPHVTGQNAKKLYDKQNGRTHEIDIILYSKILCLTCSSGAEENSVNFLKYNFSEFKQFFFTLSHSELYLNLKKVKKISYQVNIIIQHLLNNASKRWL